MLLEVELDVVTMFLDRLQDFDGFRSDLSAVLEMLCMQKTGSIRAYFRTAVVA